MLPVMKRGALINLPAISGTLLLVCLVFLSAVIASRVGRVRGGTV